MTIVTYTDGTVQYVPMKQDAPPFQIGTKVKDPGGHRWTVGAILFTGERYYMMTDKRGVVSMMPACEVERWKVC